MIYWELFCNMKKILIIFFVSVLFHAGWAAPLRFSSSPWQLTINEKNGAWISLKYKNTELLSNPAAEQTLNLNAATLKQNKDFVDQSAGEAAGVAVLESAMSAGEKESPVSLIWHQFDPAAKKLHLRYRSGVWVLEEEIFFASENRPNRLCRKARFYSTAPREIIFRNFRFSLFLPLKGKYFFPATFLTDNWWREDNHPGYPSLKWENRSGELSELKSSGNDRVKFSIINPEPNLSLVVFIDPRLDGAGVRYQRLRENLQIDWRFNAQGWAYPNKPQQLAGAYLEVAEKNADRALRENCPQMLRDLGFLPPADRPEWVRDAAIYGLSNEPFHLSKISDIPLCVMPRMKQLGLNTTWYRPSEASTGRYTPIDYKIIEPKIGTWDDYRSANLTLQKNNIRVLQDIVPHGGGQLGFLMRNQSVSMMSFTESGNVLDSWSADFNDPRWKKYMAEVCEFYTGNLKVNGFRIDAIYGSKTLRNWRKKGFPAEIPGVCYYGNQSKPYKKILPEFWEQSLKIDNGEMPPLEYERASLASAGGGINMNAAMRGGARRGDPQSAVLLESGELAFTACGDMHYDRDIQSLWFKLRALPPAEFVKGLSVWLDEQQCVDTPGTIRMRYMETGNTESWPYRKWYGFEGDKAIRALCSFIHGIPMFYETFTEGQGVFISRIMNIRKSLEPLRRGSADYRSVRSSAPEVFTVLRRTPEKSVVAAINFSPERKKTVLTLPAGIFSRNARIYDWFAEEKVSLAGNKAVLELPPFGCAVLAESPATLPAKAVRKNETPDGEVHLSETAKHLIVSADNFKVSFCRRSGLPELVTKDNGGIRLLGDLFVTRDPVGKNADIKIERSAANVTLLVNCGNMQFKWIVTPAGVTLKADSKCLRTLALEFAGARSWELDSFEGMLADFLPENPRPRLCSIIPQVGKMRSTMDHTLLWNSSDRPLDWNRPELRVFGSKDGLTMKVHGNAHHHYLHQALENRTGLFYLARFGGNDGSLSLEFTPGAKHKKSVFGKPVRIGKNLTISNESYGWKVENSFYVMHLWKSNGVISSFLAKKDGRQISLFGKQNLIASGTMFSAMPYAAAGMDPDCSIRLERKNGKLKMTFSGELRSAYILNRDPLLLKTEYTFDDSPEVDCLFSITPLCMKPGKPSMTFTAQQERFSKYFRYSAAAGASSGKIRDLSRGRQLKLQFFDGMDKPLLPRKEYKVALRFRTDGKICNVPAIPADGKIAELQMDGSLEERCSVLSEKDGRRLFLMPKEYNPALPWFIEYAAYAAPGAGRNNTAGIYLSWPNPVFRQQVNPAVLRPGRYRLRFDLSASLLTEPAVRDWSKTLVDRVFSSLRNTTPVWGYISWFDRSGKRKTVTKSFSAGKVWDWQTFEITADIPADSYAPEIRIQATPEYAGVLRLDNIVFERIDK